MTPDVFTNIQFVNATAASLVAGTQPPQNIVAYGDYQMASWFPPDLSCSSGTFTDPNHLYVAQFLRGVGDEDDGADLLLALEDAGGVQQNLFAIQARSLSNSGHYMQVTACSGNSVGQVVVGVVSGETLDKAVSGIIAWHPMKAGSTEVFGLDCAENNQAIIVADLNILYDAGSATAIYLEIASGEPSADTLGDLFAQVVGYTAPLQTTMNYSLTDVVFDNPPSPVPGGNVVLSQTTANLQAGSLTQTFSMHNTVTNTFEMTSQTTWGIGVEVGFESLPIPIGPSLTISGSFEHDAGESSTVSEAFEYEVNLSVTVPEPGKYTITGYVVMAENYRASYSGTLQIAGTVIDGTTQRPLNSTTLTAIMNDPARNAGYNAGTLTPGSDCLTAAVQGDMVANVGYSSNVSVVAADGSHGPVTAVTIGGLPDAIAA